MKCYGRAAVGDLLGDQVVYRNLTPLDNRLPGLDELREQLGLPAMGVPRKTTMEYARVIARILEEISAIDAPGSKIRHILMIGDTRMNDGGAFRNVCRVGGWRGLAFIGAENDAPSQTSLDEHSNGTILLANRWSALDDFPGFVEERGFPMDESTALLLDLDKTTIGARGRNDKLIDRARLEAAFSTASYTLDQDFDREQFAETYRHFNQPDYHPFTTDNQDYLVYLCLIVGSGLFNRDMLALAAGGQEGRWGDFNTFASEVEARKSSLPSRVRKMHGAFYEQLLAGNPTPFTQFRRFEYENTVATMGQLDDNTDPAILLKEEIVLTREVQTCVLGWKAHGVLALGISDKPDEASTPSPAQAARGYLPIHHVETHVIGA